MNLTLEQKRALAIADAKQKMASRQTQQRLADADKPKSAGQSTKEFFMGDDDPNSQNWGEYIGSALNKAGEAMTFGLIGDEASAAAESVLPGVDYEDRRDHYRKQEEVLERDNPGTALAAEVGGAMAAPLGALGAMGKGASMGKRMLASGAATSAMGGTYGFAEGEGGAKERMSEAGKSAALGAGIGAAIPLAGAGVQRIADELAGSKAIKQAVQNAPSTADLRRAGSAAYDAIEGAGVSVKPEAMRKGTGEIVDMLNAEGAKFRGAEKVMPSTVAIREALEDMAGTKANTVPYKEADVMRRYIGNSAGANLKNAGDTRLATKALGQFDDMVQGLGPDDIDAGDIKVLQETLPKARELWSRMSRSQTIDDAMESAENYVSGPASGIRNQFRRILSNKNLSRSFSDAEKKMMRKVVNGSIGERLIHLAGGGMGQIMATGGGLAAGGGQGAIAGLLAGSLARKGSEAITSKNAEVVRALIANGGMKELPKASATMQLLTEKLMRQGSAAGVQ